MCKIKEYRNKLFEKWNSKDAASSIFKNMAILSSGTVVARALTLLTAPVLTRIYSPEDFGVLSFYGAVAAILVPFGTLRYSMAIPLPKKDGVAVNLTFISLFFLSLVSLLVAFLFVFWGSSILELFSMEQLLPYWWLLPIGLAGNGLSEILGHWAVREKAFKPLAKTTVWQTIQGAVVKIGLGMVGVKPLGLLIGEIFYQTGGVLILLRSCYQTIRCNLRHVAKYRILFCLKRYTDFPRYRLPSQFLVALSTRMPILFFSWQYGAEVTGQLGLALALIALPMVLFGQTTGQAYYAEIAKIGKRNPDEIWAITKKITKRLFYTSIAPFLALFVGSPWLFEFFFGEQWLDAGIYARILSFYLLVQFITAPIMKLLNIFKTQRIFFVLNIYRFFVILISFAIGFLFQFEALYTLICYSLFYSIYCGYIFVYVMNVARSRVVA